MAHAVPPPHNPSMTVKRPKPSELMPPDYESVYADYRAGVRSLRDMAAQLGVSAPALLKHAKSRGWIRDLTGRIYARAAQKVNASPVNLQFSRVIADPLNRKDGPAAAERLERAVIEAGSDEIARVRISHRKDIQNARGIVQALMTELALVQHEPELLGKVHTMLEARLDPCTDVLRQVATIVSDLPMRVKILDKLLLSLRTVIALERETWGLDTDTGGEKPLAIVKDYTGRGDKDAPPRSAMPPAEPNQPTEV